MVLILIYFVLNITLSGPNLQKLHVCLVLGTGSPGFVKQINSHSFVAEFCSDEQFFDVHKKVPFL